MSYLDQSASEAEVDRSKIIAAMKADLNTFAAVISPDDYLFPYPDYYQALFFHLLGAINTPRDFSKLAIGLPRGFAKTTFLKLLAAYAVIFTDKRFILIVQATGSMAENFIADVWDLLDSDNVKALFGNCKATATKDTADDKEFVFAGRPVKLVGKGAQSSVRGIVRKNKRPDLQIMDDIQSREDAESDVVSAKLFKWMLATLLKTRSPFGCQHIYVGNMYPTDNCILKKLRDSEDWLSFITGAILANGDSLWEELHPIAQLKEELREFIRIGEASIFMAEMQNDPEGQPKTEFDVRLVKVWTPSVEMHQGSYIVIDPSGSTKKSDSTAIGYFELYDGVPHLRELVSKVLTPKQTISEAIGLASKYRASLIAVENVAYQSSLLFWFNEALIQLRLTGVQLAPISPRGMSKNSRILTMFRQLKMQEITLNTHLATEVFSMIYKFDATRSNNKDDILDVLAYAPIVANDYKYLIAIPDPDDIDNHMGLIEVMSEKETSAI